MERELYEAHARLEDDHWWFVGRRHVVTAVLDAYVGTSTQLRCLDVGCGTGGMLPMLAARGDVTGIEPAELAVESSRKKAPFATVVKGRVPDDIPNDGSFDLVTAFDVIEHLDDDAKAVAALRGASRPEGHVVVTVPANQWMWSDHDVVNQHRRRYSRASLVRVLQAAGLEVLYTSYFNTLLFPPAAAARLAGRFRHNQSPRSDLEMHAPSPFVNRALTSMFSFERRLVPRWRLPFGVSLIAVAKHA